MGSPSIKRMGVNRDLIQEIHSSDQSIYPAPLTYERLKSWVESCPELSISYKFSVGESDEDQPLAGVVIVLPVKGEYWRDILVGKLKETDIHPDTFVRDADVETEVGLHIFHIEKFDAWNEEIGKFDGLRPFAEFALQDAKEIVENKGWKILGYSALTATAAGQKCCKRMDFKPTGYEEIFAYTAKSGGNIEMFFLFPGQSQPDPPLQPDDEFVSKAEMMVRFL